VAGLLEAGSHITGVQYVRAMRVLQDARNGGADAMLHGVDVWAIPTMPIPPPSIEQTRARDYNASMSSLTSIIDLTGQPAISVPCGLTSTGLPVGISFVARRWDEASALRAARAYENVRGSFPTPPFGAN
jgi:Asp-tRNA(Asn)/Glu-tRNA(Gln) amidotransferase A subunit family amidase